MRLVIPVTPDNIPLLPAALNALSSVHPGQGHQLYILTSSARLSEAETFAAKCRKATKFGGVTLSSVVMSQMTAPHNYLWSMYFRNPHPDSFWFEPGSIILGGDGWLTRIQDSLQFATSLFLGPQTLHVSGVYRSGASKRLNAWEAACIKGVSPAIHNAHASRLTLVYRASPLIFASKGAAEAPAGVEIVVPPTLGVAVIPLQFPEKVAVSAPEVTVSTPEVPPEFMSMVDTPPESEVTSPPPAPRVIRRSKS